MAVAGTGCEVMILEEAGAAWVLAEPTYDPKYQRIKA